MKVQCLVVIKLLCEVAVGMSANNDVVIGFLANYGQSKVTLGALPLAIDTVNNDSSILPGKRLRFVAFNTGPESTYRPNTIKFMTDMRDQGVHAFIGPDETCTAEALVSSAWNIPMLSYQCTDSVVSDKKSFPMFARTLAPAAMVSKSVVALLMAFDWHRFVIVSSSRAWSSEVTDAIQEHVALGRQKLQLTDLRKFNDYIPIQIGTMQRIVRETYQQTRIYVFVGEHVALIDFLHCMQNLKLMDNGQYMVISVDDEIYDPMRAINSIGRDYLDPYINRSALKLQNSFRSVLKMSISYPSNAAYGFACNSIKDYARLAPFYVPSHRLIPITVPIFGAHLYDAVNIYAMAATHVLAAGGDIRNGTAIMEHIFNSTYRSLQGFDVHIDGHGDAKGNYTVIALHTDERTAIARMRVVGYFTVPGGDRFPGEEYEFRYIDEKRPIQWIGGKPPLAKPECGFENTKCKQLRLRILMITGAALVIVSIAVSFAWRHYRYEQKLAGLLWMVQRSDVTLLTLHTEPTMRTQKLVQTCRNSLTIDGETSSDSAFTNIGLYRGNIVAVKKYRKRSADLTRNMRKELKLMREIHHENILGFIGAIVEPQALTILTTYCARGSLEDVLANDDLCLDQMFVSSLVTDILRGLIYLHDSAIHSHGNLRSSNCLVDSRWVCQIGDYGLHGFRSESSNSDATTQRRAALWRAPELLRITNNGLPSQGTQKGDVYAFGIVLYEIVGRKGPWGETIHTDDEIVQRVMTQPAMNSVPFRPATASLSIPDYIRNTLHACWSEEPEQRPDVRLIRVQLKQIQAGLRPNIFDNMLAIMEKYAYNLEVRVQARTVELHDEKKKTEALLLRMLPRTVADALKCGDRVAAECFDCVTIYFSDLVGFTELCAQSTPMQVVEMLNDLYTCCDSIISNYDVYKVETIGDAYMCVSGLPERNGKRHAGEIAAMALHVMTRVQQLEFGGGGGDEAHRLHMRIGMHSGQCVAGVVGVQMPRYCLFGDTVNTAARMESHGEADRIHVSATTAELLYELGGFRLVERGIVFVKGKGEMRTFWLLNEIGLRRDWRKKAGHRNAPDIVCNGSETSSNSVDERVSDL